MIIRFGKRILSNDVRGESNPRPAECHDGPLVGGILVQSLAQFVELGVDGGLEGGDLGGGEEGAYGLAAAAVQVVIAGGEGVGRVAEAAGGVVVLVAAAGAAVVEGVVVVWIVDV